MSVAFLFVALGALALVTRTGKGVLFMNNHVASWGVPFEDDVLSFWYGYQRVLYRVRTA